MRADCLAVGPSPAAGPSLAVAILALSGLPLLAGCAGSARTISAGQPTRVAARETTRPAAHADSAIVVLEVRLRRSAELTDNRGALRVFDQDLSVEYRADRRGPGLDAGEVTLDGRPLRRQVGGKGSVSYRLGRDEPQGGTQAGGSPWATLANTGGTGVAAAPVRVKLAPFPLVTQPAPEQAVARGEELAVVMLPPVAEVWYRVSLVGAGEAVNAVDLGQGRWLFPRGSLAGLAPGRARILIEVETSCGDCPGAGLLHADWSSRAELEVPVTVL